MIGTPFGPKYSNLAVGKFEIDIAENFNVPMVEFYKRYIYSVVGTTSMSRVELDKFIDYICNFHPAFQFTFDASEKQIEFLHIKVSVCRNRLSTSVHYNAIDSHSYLRYVCFHPNAIPYSQF